MAWVKAIKLGFDGISRRRPGDIFEIPDTMPLGRWMELIEPEKPAEKVARKRGRKVREPGVTDGP